MAGAVLAILNAAENEGFAVGALAHCGVLLVSTHADLVESAVALAGVVSALSNGACNAVVVLLVHSKNLSNRKRCSKVEAKASPLVCPKKIK